MSETTNAWSTSHYNVMRTDPENNKVLCGTTKDDVDDDDNDDDYMVLARPKMMTTKNDIVLFLGTVLL